MGFMASVAGKLPEGITYSSLGTLLQTSSGSKSHCVVARSKAMFRLMVASKISG